MPRSLTILRSLTRRRGWQFTSWAKSSYYGSGWEIWTELVAPGLRNNLLVQTWRRGAGSPLPSACRNTYKVENINALTMNGDSWGYLNDHSKWGISKSGDQVCLGDLNRMASQGNRGGGVICFTSRQLRQSLLTAVQQREAC